MDYTEVNAQTIDRWVREGWEWGVPVSHQAYLDAVAGNWDVVLTPIKPVPKAWFGDLKGKHILGLACGGGQQMPIFAALGAVCTELDYSPAQLESARMVSQREGYDIRNIRADMTKPLPFDDCSFDLIFHPGSNCYVREVRPIFRECFRVLKPGGVLLGGYDMGINFLVDEKEERIVNSLPFDPIANPALMAELQQSDSGVQFSHTLEDQIGGQLAAGFQITALYEDTNGYGRLHDMGIPTFAAIRAVKPE